MVDGLINADLHNKGAFVVSFPDGGRVTVLRKSRRVVILIEQVHPDSGITVEWQRSTFGLCHNNQTQPRRTLKIESLMVTHANQSVVGIDFERVLLVATAETVGHPLAATIRPHCRHLNHVFAHGRILGQLNVVSRILEAERHLR